MSSDGGRVVVRISDECMEHARKLAADRGIELGEAADKLILLGARRQKALDRHASVKRKSLPRKAKKPATKKGKKRPLGKRRAPRVRRVAAD